MGPSALWIRPTPPGLTQAVFASMKPKHAEQVTACFTKTQVHREWGAGVEGWRGERRTVEFFLFFLNFYF